MEAASTSETSSTSPRLHGTISQKAVFFKQELVLRRKISKTKLHSLSVESAGSSITGLVVNVRMRCHVDISYVDRLEPRNVMFTGCQLQQPPN
jgi:hypothetical protein